jgi:hypothetical protein
MYTVGFNPCRIHDIAGILLKVALNTKNQISPISPVLNVFLTQNK